MKGRPPKPTALKKLEGNRGKRPLNESEPKPEPEIPTCPAHLVGASRVEWHRITKDLFRLGLLTRIDRAALAAYCIVYARWIEAEAKVRELGVLCAPPGAEDQKPLFGDAPARSVNPSELIWNPYLAVANKAMGQMLKFLVEFGMTPSSRTRLHAPNQGPEDESEDFFFGPADSAGNPKTLQ